MKNLLLSISAAIAVATTSLAQDPGVYTLGRWNGDNGTNAAITATTSVTNTIATSEYNSASLVFSLKCTGAATGNAIVRMYRSLDSTRYETTATTNLVALNGTTEVVSVIPLSESFLANVGTVRVCLDNTNAAAAFTNITGRVRFNAPSLRIKGN